MRKILLATIITHLLYGCSSDADNVGGSTKTDPTIAYINIGSNEKVSVISSFVLNTEDDLTVLSNSEVILRMQALDFSHRDGYLAANYFEHAAIAPGISCDACHDESALTPEILHYVTNAKPKIISGKIGIDGDNITF